jgi:hypothetical protein
MERDLRYKILLGQASLEEVAGLSIPQGIHDRNPTKAAQQIAGFVNEPVVYHLPRAFINPEVELITTSTQYNNQRYNIDRGKLVTFDKATKWHPCETIYLQRTRNAL